VEKLDLRNRTLSRCVFAACRNCRRKSEDDAGHDLDHHSSLRHSRHLRWRFVSIFGYFSSLRSAKSFASFFLHFT